MKIKLIGITGTPATGKSRFALSLAKKLRTFSLIELNDIVEKCRCYSSRDKWGTRIVDLKKLEKSVAYELKLNKKVILVGHLLADLKIKPDITVVTRLSLMPLAKRLEKRQYVQNKLRDNLICEATDYCGMQLKRRSPSVYEVETSMQKNRLITHLSKLTEGKKSGFNQIEISKFKQIIKIANSKNNYGL